MIKESQAVTERHILYLEWSHFRRTVKFDCNEQLGTYQICWLYPGFICVVNDLFLSLKYLFVITECSLYPSSLYPSLIVYDAKIEHN